jgi:hypothetical protein
VFGAKLTVWLSLGAALAAGTSYYAQANVEKNRNVELRAQLDDRDDTAQDARLAHWSRNHAYAGAVTCWALLGALLFSSDVWRTLKKVSAATMALVLMVTVTGCGWRPFEPVVLETIGNSEEGFLIPYTGDSKKQASSNNEEYLKQNLVYTKQVRITQQWVPKGYETFGSNGEWQPAAKLIKVDKAPVTREWTADENSGTSNKNEAIWVMTSDQVEFSTGWTATARIESRDDAVKFLHNYPAGSLKEVMDGEMRAKLQSTFGLEVTDLPMDELRKQATPHIQNTTKIVKEFFKERGITITNLGITGGFVYKDKSIKDMMVKVFNSEQEKAIAAAGNAAQEEKNKQILAEAKGKAEALMLEKKAEADGKKLLVDSVVYELESVSKNPNYLRIRQLDIEKARWEKWGGQFPTMLFGATGSMAPNVLLTVPSADQPMNGAAATASADKVQH